MFSEDVSHRSVPILLMSCCKCFASCCGDGGDHVIQAQRMILLSIHSRSASELVDATSHPERRTIGERLVAHVVVKPVIPLQSLTTSMRTGSYAEVVSCSRSAIRLRGWHG